MIKGVYFDLDNTLIPLGPRQVAALTVMWQALQPHLRADATVDAFIAGWRDGTRAHWDTVAKGDTWTYTEYLRVNLEFVLKETQAEVPPAEVLQQALAEFHAAMLVANPEEGAAELLRHLSEQYMVGIITNGPPGPSQYKKLQCAGLLSFVEGRIYNSGDLGVLKPDPAIFDLALPPGLKTSEMLFVGDNLYADIQGAQSAGWQAIWFNPTGRDRPADSALPSATIRHLLDLRPWLAARTA